MAGPSMPTVFSQQTILKPAAIVFLTVLVLLTGCMKQQRSPGTDDNTTIDIFLLTTNDLHGRLEPFSIATNQGEQTVGGFAGLAAGMDLIARKNPHAVLRLNSGDTLTGPYAAQFKGEALFGALSRMGIDAATLGNHEFNNGPNALAQALEYCSFPILLTNVDLPNDHVLAGKIKTFSLFERAGKRLLIIGLLTPSVSRIASPGPDIHVFDPISSKTRKRISALIKEHKPDLVIALTHLGLEQDRRLALNIPEIDVICGGHSHDMLPPNEAVSIQHADGRKTVIIQSGSGGIMLGVLRIQLQADTQPTYFWQPRKINASSPQCPKLLAFIERYRSTLPSGYALTSTDTPIDCRSAILRSREAPIANFIADSMREYFNTDIALYNSGGIRGDCILPAGSLTSMDVETMLPFGNEAVIITMAGTELRQILERSIMHLPQPWGGFLHVSGLRMRIDTEQGITEVAIQEKNGAYTPLDPKRMYQIVINEFLAKGGNGYHLFSAADTKAQTGILIRDIIIRRLAAQPYHSFKTDGRISRTEALQPN